QHQHCVDRIILRIKTNQYRTVFRILLSHFIIFSQCQATGWCHLELSFLARQWFSQSYLQFGNELFERHFIGDLGGSLEEIILQLQENNSSSRVEEAGNDHL